MYLRKREAEPEIRYFRRHQHLVREGEAPATIYQVEDGWACRYRLLNGGRRQITTLFLPGEYCEPQWLLGDRTTHPVVALTALRARRLPLAEFSDGTAVPREVVKTMLAATLCALDRQTEWIATLGRKTAFERLCALLSELFERLRGKGRVIDGRCPMPLTQIDLADIVGLTPVHVNRVLKGMRSRGLIELRGRWLSVPDIDALRRIGAAA